MIEAAEASSRSYTQRSKDQGAGYRNKQWEQVEGKDRRNSRPQECFELCTQRKRDVGRPANRFQ
jgi:hypothetical protein